MADARFRWGAWLGAMGLALVAAPAAAQGQPAQVTFTKDVAPIFQKACESCHRKDSIGPMSLVTYEESRPWARSIKSRVAARQMPPWHIDKNVGIQHFANDRSLNDAEIATIVKWVDAGAPKGDMKDMPAPVQWPSDQDWNFAKTYGKPDLVYSGPLYKSMQVEGNKIVLSVDWPTESDRIKGAFGVARDLAEKVVKAK